MSTSADLIAPAPAAAPAPLVERSETGHDGAGAAGAFPWLEDTTRQRPKGQGWSWIPSSISTGWTDSPVHDVLVIVKPSVGKAVALYRPVESPLESLRAIMRRSALDPSTGKLVDPVTGELVNVCSDWSQLDADERAAECAARADARATSNLSDYMVHNRLVKMWPLTFVRPLYGPEGRREAMRQTAAFVRKLRHTIFRDRPFPYVYSPELHPGGHGWHVNLFLQSVYIDKHQMQKLWGHGNVWFTDFTKDRVCKHTGRRIGAVRAGGSTGGTARAARKAAAYAAKYAHKDWDLGEMGAGAHRYERSEGFNVPEQRLRVRSFEDFTRLMHAHPAMGEVYVSWALDTSTPGWMGPPMRGLMFDHGRTSGGQGSKRKKSSVPISSVPLTAAGSSPPPLL